MPDPIEVIVGQLTWRYRDIGGQGGRCLECIICSANEWAGPLTHKDGCEQLTRKVCELRLAEAEVPR